MKLSGGGKRDWEAVVHLLGRRREGGLEKKNTHFEGEMEKKIHFLMYVGGKVIFLVSFGNSWAELGLK